MVSRAPAVGTNTSSSVATDVESSREDMRLFSRVSISCRMATFNLSKELSAKGSALNTKQPTSPGIFFRSMGISKLPYDSVFTPSVSKPRILALHKS